MIAEIKSGIACGDVTVPPSKSMAHRFLICAGLANGKSTVNNIALSDDIKATLNCLKSLGADFVCENNSIVITGINSGKNLPISADCNESGSTLRFFIPIIWALGANSQLCGKNYLFTRPLSVYSDIAKQKNLIFEKYENKVVLGGKLTNGEFKINGDISSQFISGLLFSLPLCENNSTIKLIPPIMSKPYIDMTVLALKTFGININWLDENTIFIEGNQQYKPNKVTVEGDYSNAAFFAALNSMGDSINISGLSENSLQGDKIVFKYLEMLEIGYQIIDVADCPDIAPILITAAAYLNGGEFTGTARLKLKESDRAEAIALELSKFGADIKVLDDKIIVTKTPLSKPNKNLSGHNDHRIVMSLAVLLTKFSGKIEQCEAVNKSFPDFFEKLKSLGIEVNFYEDNQ